MQLLMKISNKCNKTILALWAAWWKLSCDEHPLPPPFPHRLPWELWSFWILIDFSKVCASLLFLIHFRIFYFCYMLLQKKKISNDVIFTKETSGTRWLVLSEEILVLLRKRIEKIKLSINKSFLVSALFRKWLKSLIWNKYDELILSVFALKLLQE